MAIPKENRQMMINLMYLVLTALLALNVSAEILNAFNVIDKSMRNSGKIVDIKNKAVFNGFAAQKLKEPGNANISKYEGYAQQVLTMSQDLQGYIDDLQKELLAAAGGVSPEDGLMSKKDDVDIPTALLVDGPKGKGDGKAYVLKSKIEETRKKMLAFVDPADLQGFEERFTLSTKPIVPTKGQDKADWVRENFAQMPAIAAQTMLTKSAQDVKNAEGQMLDYLYSKIGSSQALKPEEVVFDVFSARITAPSTYLMQGEPFEADVFLAASSSGTKDKVRITVNGSGLPVNNEGVAKYRVLSGIGDHTVNGTITVVNDRTNQSKSYPLEPLKYTVAAPTAAISLDKLNVFYIGLDNPITVNAAGIKTSDLNVTVSNGQSVSTAVGKYNVRVQGGGSNISTVTVKGPNGKVLGAGEYRIKSVPDPLPMLGNKKPGGMPSGEMKAQVAVAAILEGFVYDARFEVLSYNVGIAAKREDFVLLPNSGAYLTAPVKSALAKVKPGDVVYVEEIKVKGPDGTVRKLASIAYKIL